MTYTEKVLMPGESVIYSGKVTWFVYLKSIVFLIGGLLFIYAATIVSADDATSSITPIGMFCMIIGMLLLFGSPIMFVRALIARWTTELVVTTERVIAKFGLIKRKTAELNINRFESLGVDQSILGRLLNYGTITISGTGGGIAPVPSIDNPLQFRQEVIQASGKHPH